MNAERKAARELVADAPVTNALEDVMGETEIRRWQMMKEQAETAFHSGYLPNHVKSLEAARAIAMAGTELGIPPMTAYRVIYFFDGKIALAASLMLALAHKRVKDFKLDYVKTNENGAWVTAWRPGMTEPAKIAFTMEDATRANLTGKDNWKKYPAAMCRARATAAAVRAVAPEAILGVLATEEIDDGVPYEQVFPDANASAPVDELKDRIRNAQNGNGAPKEQRQSPPPGFDGTDATPPPGFATSKGKKEKEKAETKKEEKPQAMSAAEEPFNDDGRRPGDEG